MIEHNRTPSGTQRHNTYLPRAGIITKFYPMKIDANTPDSELRFISPEREYYNHGPRHRWTEDEMRHNLAVSREIERRKLGHPPATDPDLSGWPQLLDIIR